MPPRTHRRQQSYRERPARPALPWWKCSWRLPLVLLLMSLFAQVFQIAGGSLVTQRGIAENDQRSRSLTTIILADLDKRTFRRMVPFYRDEHTDVNLPRDFEDRKGYFYISENDPNNDTDDVLQFTVRSTITTVNEDETPYYGRARLLTTKNSVSDFIRNPNQPTADDGQLDIGDDTSSSSAAEISYFLRNGNLYRSVLLIREPLPISGTDSDPTNADGDRLFDNPGAPTFPEYNDVNPTDPPVAYAGPTTFWNDFDFSVVSTVRSSGANDGATFHGISSLSNNPVGAAPTQLGIPVNRFGHNHDFYPDLSSPAGPRDPRNGQPKEYLYDDNQATFIGRYTMEERSNSIFKYPQKLSVGGDNPMGRVVTTTFDTTAGVVSEYASGPRRAEDLLMSNVLSFDVKVWDDRLGTYVDIGHGNANGNFASAKRLNPIYGPFDLLSTPPANPPVAYNNIFDTWHPDFYVYDDRPGYLVQNSNPPYRPRLRTLVDSDTTEYTDTGADGASWWPNAPEGAYVFAPALSFSHDRAVYVFRCVQAGAVLGGNPFLNVTEPEEQIVDGTAIWESLDNFLPLRSIRITIRFLDTTSGQVRQLTLAHSFLD